MPKYNGAAYFDLDGTLLDASSEKSLTAKLARKKPWRIPLGATMWILGTLGNLLRGRSFYDATRNRGHFTLASWEVLDSFSQDLVKNKLLKRITPEAKECLEWHRNQGHRLVLVSATIAPMAEAMGEALGMDYSYGCGPKNRIGRLSGSEKGWSVPRRKGKVPIVQKDAKENGHNLSECYAYGNTMADSWFMRITGNPIAVNPEGSLKRYAEENNWKIVNWKI